MAPSPPQTSADRALLQQGPLVSVLGTGAVHSLAGPRLCTEWA